MEFIEVIDVPGLTALVIDVKGIVREDIKQSIQDTRIQEFLPFQTEIVEGKTYFHIRNLSVYDIDTKFHTIEQGDTLCARLDGWDDPLESLRYVTPTCPGCLAKARNIIATHLLDSTAGPRE